MEHHAELSPWNCLFIIDYRVIATYGSNWRDIFEKHYTKPGEEKTKWMQKLEKIRNQVDHSYSIKEEDYMFVMELHEWLVKKNIKNKFA